MLSLQYALIALALVMCIIPVQTRLFKAYGVVQPIRKELPADQQKKQGTPLMGGLVFIIGVLVFALARQSPLAAFLAGAFVLYSAIGFSDDFKKAYTKLDGISARAKLGLQVIVTGAALYYLLGLFEMHPALHITRSVAFDIPLSAFVIGVGLIVIGSTNAINFTDGLDGLLSVVAIPTYFFFFVISSEADVKVFCLIMMATLLGFLFYNRFPASLIMGDTGSMAIGGTLSLLAVMEHVLILLPVLFFVYFAEILSVIIQVSHFKRTGRRIFLMSPIHYHFSLKYGWKENTIVVVFGTASWICALLCLGYYEVFMRP